MRLNNNDTCLAQGACFVAGTLVHTARGLVPIQEVKVGDKVLSKPENGEGDPTFKPVVKTFKSEQKQALFKVAYHNSQAYDRGEQGLSHILCTADHPFWRSLDPNSEKGEWTPAHRLFGGYLSSLKGEKLELDDYSIMPVRTLPHFPDHCAYTQTVEDRDIWRQNSDSTADVMFLEFTQAGYAYLGLSKDVEDRDAIRDDYGELNVVDAFTALNINEPVKINSELMKLLLVRLDQDIFDIYSSVQQFIDGINAPLVVDGKVISETSIADNDMFMKALNRLKKYGVDLGDDYGDSLHFSMENYTDDCPNPYKDYVYNLEVADYHTYYVGYDGVWVHNCDPNTVA